MITQDFGQIFPENFIQAMKEASERLQKGFKKQNPINALLMDEIFQIDDEGIQAFITFDGDILMIENRQNADVWVAMTGTELWQIVAFALDNGLELPTNEDDKE